MKPTNLKRITLFIFFLIAYQFAVSQSVLELRHELDSLINIESKGALSKAKQLEKLAKKESNNEGLAVAYASMAKIYYKKKSYNKSIKYFEKELKLLSSKLEPEKLAESYYNLGTTCLKVNKNSKAINNYELSLKKAIEINNTELIKANYNALVVVSGKMSQYKKSSFYLTQILELEHGVLNDRIELYKKEAVHYKKVSRKYKRISKDTQIELDTVNQKLETSAETIDILEEDTLKKHKEIVSLNFQKLLKDFEIESKSKELVYQKRISDILTYGVLLISVLAIVVFILMLLKRKINKELTIQKDKISKQNKSITQSIQYASKIQQAVLPNQDLFNNYFTESFVIFQPRDIVSGDFYFLQKVNHHIVFAAVDCTGHGVPGAFMSMLGVAFLNEIIRKNEVTQANQVLNILRNEVKNSLHQTGLKGEQKDGMDIAIGIINTKTNELQYAGAHNPLILIRSGEIIEYKADRMPIGIYRKEKEFTNHVISLKPKDKLYLFSDGFADQLGEETKKKYKLKPLKSFIQSNAHLSMVEQKELLINEFNNWKGNHKQIDDMVMIGIEV